MEKMLARFFEQIKNDQSIRKVLVKTDDQLKGVNCINNIVMLLKSLFTVKPLIIYERI